MRWLYLRLTEKLYREWSGIYDPVSLIVSLGKWSDWRSRALDYAAGDEVLELGFGTGHLLQATAASGRHGVGVDASPQMAALAAHRLRMRVGCADVVQGRAQDLPFADEAFDSVVSTFPARYISDRETMHECVRVLRRSGAGPGVLVVVGVWVDAACPLLRIVFAPFYGTPNWRMMLDYASTLRDASLAPAILEEEKGMFRIGVVLAVKQRNEQPVGTE